MRGEHMRSGFLEKRNNLLALHARKTLQKLLDPALYPHVRCVAVSLPSMQPCRNPSTRLPFEGIERVPLVQTQAMPTERRTQGHSSSI